VNAAVTYQRYPPLEAPEVQVLVDGTWHHGVAEARRREGDGWLWYVRWSPTPGENHLGWYNEDHLRRAADDPSSAT
jgi:hypothetical protein